MEYQKLNELVAKKLINKDSSPIYANTMMFLQSLRNLLDNVEITLEQYATCLRRSRE